MKKIKNFRYRHLLLLFSLCAVILSALTGCTSAKADSRIQITFWHEMTGPAQVQLTKFVKEFNQSQNKYTVVPQFEGNYNEAVQKILNTHGTSASPAVFQSMDISTSQIYSSGYTTPVQKFITADNYDVSKISAVARAFYSKNGQQLSMPFNTSQPVLYYNATLLKKYGITPPPVDPSYSDITCVAQQLYERSGKKVKGLSVEIYGWLFEQFLANAGESLANNQDGHAGTPTAVNFTGTAATTTMKWIQENIKHGSFMNYGSGTSASANEMAGFLSGKLGMFLQSSADISQLTAGMKDQLGITYYPHPDGQKSNGVSIGGASLWISNDKSTTVQRGAWEFIKYLMKSQNQAAWQAATGYLALNKDSQNEPVLQKLYQKTPAAKIPSQQLARTTPNNTNSGIFMQGLIQERTITQTAMEQIYNGKSVTSALQDAEKQMNSYVQTTNKANK
ncbi:ABC transporter substrate-binding protein [Liquorilactobacillus satsumensis]|uniref:ABC transporter substrate-binding protein n=1 Tax=Liquorilactobacillus satsumensis TaxID=259059 RepID=UPI001E42F8FE|nr:ABC transporter substrate-binding protein [Liquorilactobacillus satsumensis]MCC7666139.1 ABC transporter substrate-binding protein [Liquorilactobacillus satsumensis]MCP9357406.1 ABC transporter substrate-binding protein [Liquorilactobacillus satsumensis]MCP9371234.1 ABC transporter substrate-binding protein [Liquorilactobacillus satsumensis]